MHRKAARCLDILVAIARLHRCYPSVATPSSVSIGCIVFITDDRYSSVHFWVAKFMPIALYGSQRCPTGLLVGAPLFATYFNSSSLSGSVDFWEPSSCV